MQIYKYKNLESLLGIFFHFAKQLKTYGIFFVFFKFSNNNLAKQ